MNAISITRRARRRARRAGFTLIELLLVLVILATLSAIVAPKFVGRGEQARQTAAGSSIGNIETALEAFEIDCGRFPTQSEGLDALVEQPSDADGWRGPYLKDASLADPWGNAYVYRYPGRHNANGYDLYSFGPDKTEGNADDIGNWSKDK